MLLNLFFSNVHFYLMWCFTCSMVEDLPCCQSNKQVVFPVLSESLCSKLVELVKRFPERGCLMWFLKNMIINCIRRYRIQVLCNSLWDYMAVMIIIIPTREIKMHLFCKEIMLLESCLQQKCLRLS